MLNLKIKNWKNKIKLSLYQLHLGPKCANAIILLRCVLCVRAYLGEYNTLSNSTMGIAEQETLISDCESRSTGQRAYRYPFFFSPRLSLSISLNEQVISLSRALNWAAAVPTWNVIAARAVLLQHFRAA